MTDLLTKCWAQYHALGACKCLSLDCTYKVPLKVVGTHPDDKQSILTAINLYGGIEVLSSQHRPLRKDQLLSNMHWNTTSLLMCSNKYSS